jgi:hypothetical protein
MDRLATSMHIPQTLSPAAHEFLKRCLAPRALVRPSAEALLEHEFIQGHTASGVRELRDDLLQALRKRESKFKNKTAALLYDDGQDSPQLSASRTEKTTTMPAWSATYGSDRPTTSRSYTSSFITTQMSHQMSASAILWTDMLHNRRYAVMPTTGIWQRLTYDKVMENVVLEDAFHRYHQVIRYLFALIRSLFTLISTISMTRITVITRLHASWWRVGLGNTSIFSGSSLTR